MGPLRRAKPISGYKLWPVIAQQVRDSAVNSNYITSYIIFPPIEGNALISVSRKKLILRTFRLRTELFYFIYDLVHPTITEKGTDGFVRSQNISGVPIS